MLWVVRSLTTTKDSCTDFTKVWNVEEVKSSVCVDEMLNTKVVT